MPNPVDRRSRESRLNRIRSALLLSLPWLVLAAFAISRLRQTDAVVVAVGALLMLGVTQVVLNAIERARYLVPLDKLTESVRETITGVRDSPLAAPAPVLDDLTREIAVLSRLARKRKPEIARTRATPSSDDRMIELPLAALTQSGLYDAPLPQADGDPNLSGDYSTADMVNRLDPISFQWLESSAAEQIFLGFTLEELRRKSFLDLLYPEDRGRAREMLSYALVKGEALGLIVRIRTADGKTYAVEVNVGARYGTNQKVSHLRCHLTDVTEKVRAERQLRLRTQELTQVNEQLRRINRELEELKDRYTDLYENAPAMYFSLDSSRRVVECNQTMLTTLGRTREQTVSRVLDKLVSHSCRDQFRAWFEDLLQAGALEEETRWVKSSGEVIEVWMLGTVVRTGKDSTIHARFLAQDVTAKRRLEAELHEKNERLAAANDELSTKNRELDEFVHVVSHDLQEPLRTLIAFSDFLQKDFGDRLEGEGREYLSYLVDASRRMRAMIQGMLTLSRAGKVIGEFSAVDLGDLMTVVAADVRELFRSRGGELKIAGPLPVVWGDRNRLGQLLVNLISNGIKFNKNKHPMVEVGPLADERPGSADGEVDPMGPRLGFYVRDNGIGIEPQFHGAIFQLFRRLHTQEEYEGTGAGLAICGKIIQAHGGRIWVLSAPNQGSTFCIRLRRPELQASGIAAPDASLEPPSTETAASQMSTDEFNAL